MSFLEDVADQLNLRWAWEKVRRAATPGDVWINQIELAGFEVELERNLRSIGEELQHGSYRLHPLRPMAFPKNPKKDGKQQVRQYFNVSVRDQVAWTALVNIIGPHLDPLMPTWSYGNRLFRSIWVDTGPDGTRRRKVGRYRHSSGQIYLSFGQSWPVFRRHIFLATSAMTTKGAPLPSSPLTEEDAEELSFQERLESEYRCPFVQKDYWNERQPDAAKDNLFWCSVDLEKFYPSLKLSLVLQCIVEFLPTDSKAEAHQLLESMMRFRLDTDGWSEEDLKAIGLKARQQRFKCIPTGLYVAGFLANVGLLKTDREVGNRLAKRNIAHFRFVDDHVMLAYSFDELVSWIDEYLELLATSGTGARVNPEKIEPEELARFYSSRKRAKKSLATDAGAAAKACKLNPQFPTPLMTKTLALVSAIARTDFNLLEESELASLTDQLEHMLLVELPEAEIPERTRLSFAATKLMRLAECRLSNNSRLSELACRREALLAKLGHEDLPIERRLVLEEERKAMESETQSQSDKLDREVGRAFGLLRKVLQERPDRVRLWTRAIQMCRQTGVKGIKEILEDIGRVEREYNTLAAEYLMANTLALLGTEAVIAARLVCNQETAAWRRNAALSFLSDVVSAPIVEPVTTGRRWFLEISWRQFCFGLFCADSMFKSEQTGYSSQFPRQFISIGERCIAQPGNLEPPLNWAWWAVRGSTRELSSRADTWAVEIGRRLPPSASSHDFWRFFPFDVPLTVLQSMRDDRAYTSNVASMAGWWHDALRANPETATSIGSQARNPDLVRALRNIQSATNSDFVSLHEWCKGIRATDTADPRTGEWTALEIIRQIALAIKPPREFSTDYVSEMLVGGPPEVYLHPANFRLPRKWLEKRSPTWSEWVTMVRSSNLPAQVEIVPEDLRITDTRYTPILSPENSLFGSINPVRGLGLLLYGLLRHDFELPSVWNGPGHADVLSFLPRLLLRGMTCSSWTLGVLQACLQSRAMENLFFRVHPLLGVHLDDDSLHDPIVLLTPRQVGIAITKCQSVLETNQLSTINHQARQLTPISILQLSRPDWATDFRDSLAASTDEH